MANAVIYFASSLTREAKNTTKYLSQTMVNSEFSDSQKLDLIYFMAQLRARNLKIENILFTLDWSVLVAVSINACDTHSMTNNSILDNINNHHLLDYNLSDGF